MSPPTQPQPAKTSRKRWKHSHPPACRTQQKTTGHNKKQRHERQNQPTDTTAHTRTKQHMRAELKALPYPAPQEALQEMRPRCAGTGMGEGLPVGRPSPIWMSLFGSTAPGSGSAWPGFAGSVGLSIAQLEFTQLRPVRPSSGPPAYGFTRLGPGFVA